MGSRAPACRVAEQRASVLFRQIRNGHFVLHLNLVLTADANGSTAKDVRLKKGTPPTMFLSYVAAALRSYAAADGSDKWRADPSDGFLKAGVRR